MEPETKLQTFFKYFLLPLAIVVVSIIVTYVLNRSAEKINRFNALVSFSNSYSNNNNTSDSKKLALRALYEYDNTLAIEWFVDLMNKSEDEYPIIIDFLEYAALKYNDSVTVRRNADFLKSMDDSIDVEFLLEFIGEKSGNKFTKEVAKNTIRQKEDMTGYFIVSNSIQDSLISQLTIKHLEYLLEKSKPELRELGINHGYGVKKWVATNPKYKWALVPLYGIKDSEKAKEALAILIKNGIPNKSYITYWDY